MLEVELKFEIPEDAHAAFRALPALAGARPVDEQLLALYFDTPAEEIAGHRMALRLRRSGRKWRQALKAGASGSGGLHARAEWEYPRRGPSLDLALFAHTPLAKLRRADRLHERLHEVFRVDVARTTWEVPVPPGGRVEVALDRGMVVRGARSDAVSEVEIECLEGEPHAVFDFAERLLGSVPMRPSAVTKAQRGYRLLRDDEDTPVKTRRAKLRATMPPGEAARASLAAALDALQANEHGVLTHADPEYLHQMRTALRHIRSALRTYRPVTAPGFEPVPREEIRRLGHVMGEARDWDVLGTHTLPALLAAQPESADGHALAAKVAAIRSDKRSLLREALRSPRYARFILALARRIAQAQAPAAPDGKLRAFARGRLDKRWGKVEASAREVALDDPERRHRLRIAAKRLRYAAEGFAPLYSARRTRKFLRCLSRLQDDLGDANDAAVALRLLAGLDLPPGLRRFVRAWLGQRTRSAVAGVEGHLARLRSAPRFWRER